MSDGLTRLSLSDPWWRTRILADVAADAEAEREHFSRYADALRALPSRAPRLAEFALELVRRPAFYGAQQSCRDVEAAVPAAIADALPDLGLLVTLRLSDCGVTADGLAIVLPLCRALLRLDLDHNPIGRLARESSRGRPACDQLVEAFGDGTLAGLTRLDVTACFFGDDELLRLSEAATERILDGSLSLTTLWMGYGEIWRFGAPWTKPDSLTRALARVRATPSLRVMATRALAGAVWPSLTPKFR